MRNLKYLFAGIFLGIIFVKAEVISWFRIQEMFRFQAFHMYGIIGSAVLVGAISVFLIKKLNIKTLAGQNITYESKKLNKGTIIGGLLFGIGWAFTGACPGPLYALIGSGYWVIIIAFLSALAGVWVYGFLRKYIG